MHLIKQAMVIGFGLILFVFYSESQATVEQVISGLDQPVRLVAPVGDSRLFVVEQGGLIRVFDQQGQDLDTFLDLTNQTSASGERGLLGLAFPADYATSGRFYVNYTNNQGDTEIARFDVSSDNPNTADSESQEIILRVDQPFGNHNGGQIEFGPDGMLYIGLGDGGGAGDTGNRSQNELELLGKMLRIDVSGDLGYSIPADNPFVEKSPLDEIWALGLRNPWCYAFDQVTGDLYIADVGQGSQEEIDIQPVASNGGENYGWRLMEGTACFNPPSDCNDGDLTLPAHTYSRGGSPFRCSISGGYVYRGSSIPSLWGHYFFSDYCSKQIWSLTWTESGGVDSVVDHTEEMTPPGGYGSVASFGQDGFGEIYILDITNGRAFRILDSLSSVSDIPDRHLLAQNFPNPFNPRTEISFFVESSGALVTLDVFDAAGRHIRTLVNDHLSTGDHLAVWNGTDELGIQVGSGVYLYRLEQDGEAFSRKMLLLE